MIVSANNHIPTHEGPGQDLGRHGYFFYEAATRTAESLRYRYSILQQLRIKTPPVPPFETRLVAVCSSYHIGIMNHILSLCYSIGSIIIVCAACWSSGRLRGQGNTPLCICVVYKRNDEQKENACDGYAAPMLCSSLLCCSI